MAGRLRDPGGTHRPTRTWVEVDLGALRRNLATLRRRTAPHQLMAVVKADAYGHGALPVARTLVAEGVDYLAVASSEEGQVLRAGGIKLPILVLGWTPPEHAAHVVERGLTQAVFGLQDARELAGIAARTGRRARVQLKVDTGMGRLGLPILAGDPASLARAVREAQAVAALKGLELEGLFTHFARADEPEETTTRGQLARFEAFVAACRAAGVTFRHVHAANSAAALRYPWAQLNMVRPGISLYGYSPLPTPAPAVTLEPVLSWYARLAFIKRVPPGTGISYGHRYRTTGTERVGTVSVGYADGFARALSNVGRVLLGGRRLPVVGRVCMDHVMVILPDDLTASPGDGVVLIGRSGSERLTAADLAAQLETIPYEVLTAIGARVPRLHLQAPH